MQWHAPNEAHNLVSAPALMARHGLTNGLQQHVCDQCFCQTFRTAYKTQGKSYDAAQLVSPVITVVLDSL